MSDSTTTATTTYEDYALRTINGREVYVTPSYTTNTVTTGEDAIGNKYVSGANTTYRFGIVTITNPAINGGAPTEIWQMTNVVENLTTVSMDADNNPATAAVSFTDSGTLTISRDLYGNYNTSIVNNTYIFIKGKPFTEYTVGSSTGFNLDGSVYRSINMTKYLYDSGHALGEGALNTLGASSMSLDITSLSSLTLREQITDIIDGTFTIGAYTYTIPTGLVANNISISGDTLTMTNASSITVGNEFGLLNDFIYATINRTGYETVHGKVLVRESVATNNLIIQGIAGSPATTITTITDTISHRNADGTFSQQTILTTELIGGAEVRTRTERVYWKNAAGMVTGWDDYNYELAPGMTGAGLNWEFTGMAGINMEAAMNELGDAAADLNSAVSYLLSALAGEPVPGEQPESAISAAEINLTQLMTGLETFVDTLVGQTSEQLAAQLNTIFGIGFFDMSDA